MSRIKDLEIAHRNAALEFAGMRSVLEDLIIEIKHALSEYIADSDIEIADILGRVKTEESFKEKCRLKYYEDPISEMLDLAGVRVVCLFDPDLERVVDILKANFQTLEIENKATSLGTDVMGYQGHHCIVQLGESFSGPRYNKLLKFKCEIQVRTVLQDAWSQISHKLVYKTEDEVPIKLRRRLNNVSSMIEIAQEVFDTLRSETHEYIDEINQDDFGLYQSPIDIHTLEKYTNEAFPNHGVSPYWQGEIVRDINKLRYKKIEDIANVVSAAEPYIKKFSSDEPGLFNYGTDYITKSLGLMDEDFRERHAFSHSTLMVFDRIRRRKDFVPYSE